MKRWATKLRLARPRIPMRTITPTMMRIILRALLPPAVGGGATGAATVPETAAPHLLQNFVPGVRFAPQELQKAMSHLVMFGSHPYFLLVAICDILAAPNITR